MRETLKQFFKHFEGQDEILVADIREWFFEFNNFEIMNVNPYYFFMQNLTCFIKKAPNPKARKILWDKAKKKKLI